MKTLSILALCAVLSSTAAYAATPATQPVEAKLAAAAAAKPTSTPAAKPAAKSAATPAALHGLWSSVNATGGAMAGSIELRADGRAVLAPKGEIRLEGTWRVEGKSLVLDMPPYGSSQMQYATSAKGLTLTYENGVKQQFTHPVKKK